jgi:hypothetical protein
MYIRYVTYDNLLDQELGELWFLHGQYGTFKRTCQHLCVGMVHAPTITLV